MKCQEDIVLKGDEIYANSIEASIAMAGRGKQSIRIITSNSICRQVIHSSCHNTTNFLFAS